MAQCDQNWTFLGADSTPGHANAPDMVISTLPGLTLSFLHLDLYGDETEKHYLNYVRIYPKFV